MDHIPTNQTTQCSYESSSTVSRDIQKETLSTILVTGKLINTGNGYVSLAITPLFTVSSIDNQFWNDVQKKGSDNITRKCNSNTNRLEDRVDSTTRSSDNILKCTVLISAQGSICTQTNGGAIGYIGVSAE